MAAILIIDDDSGVSGVLRMMLERAGHVAVVASNGDEGLRLARLAPPALAIVDVEMPGMSGLDVCVAMKTDALLQRVPVIIMTGRPLTGVSAKAQAAGAVDFWSKPFERQQVLRKVALALAAGGPTA